MQIILFSGDAPDKILAGQKTMTARHWKRKPPEVGALFRAQRGRRKDTAFAVCEVVQVEEWDGFHVPFAFREDYARLEGFGSFSEFRRVYSELNAHNWDDEGRKHYFIEFRVVGECLAGGGRWLDVEREEVS